MAASVFMSNSITKFGNWNNACFMYDKIDTKAIVTFIDSSVLVLNQQNSVSPIIDFFKPTTENIKYDSNVEIYVRAHGSYPLDFHWFFKRLGESEYIKLTNKESVLHLRSHAKM